MRWPAASAVIRRDDQLTRIRRLTVWIAGGATAASLGLAAVLGHALPGHAAAKTAPPVARNGATTRTGSGSRAGSSSRGSGSGSAAHAGSHSTRSRRTGSGHSNQGGGQVSPPSQPPASTVAPPVVSSGGS